MYQCIAQYLVGHHQLRIKDPKKSIPFYTDIMGEMCSSFADGGSRAAVWSSDLASSFALESCLECFRAGMTVIDTLDFPQWNFKLWFLTTLPEGETYKLTPGTKEAHDYMVSGERCFLYRQAPPWNSTHNDCYPNVHRSGASREPHWNLRGTTAPKRTTRRSTIRATRRRMGSVTLRSIPTTSTRRARSWSRLE